jgi:hypothetical protein
MFETPDDLDSLNALLKESIDSAGTYLRKAFEMPAASMGAEELVRQLGGLSTLAFATAGRRAEPRVAPVSVLTYRANFYIPSVTAAARVRHLQHSPASSMTGFEHGWAMIAHGEAFAIDRSEGVFGSLNRQMQECGLSDIREWGEATFLHFKPNVLFTWVRDRADETGSLQ